MPKQLFSKGSFAKTDNIDFAQRYFSMCLTLSPQSQITTIGVFAIVFIILSHFKKGHLVKCIIDLQNSYD